MKHEKIPKLHSPVLHSRGSQCPGLSPLPQHHLQGYQTLGVLVGGGGGATGGEGGIHGLLAGVEVRGITIVPFVKVELL